MNTGRSQTQNHITRLNFAAIDDFRFFYRADRKTSQIVFTIRIHGRHFSCFTTDQRAASLLATESHAFDHVRGCRHIEFAASEIIEEEQRLGTLHQNVVDAHRNQIDTNRVMLIQMKCQFQLGTNAVGTRDQHRFFEFFADFKHRAKTTDTGHDAFAHRAFCKRLDRIDQRVASNHIDTGVGVRERNRGRSAHDIRQ